MAKAGHSVRRSRVRFPPAPQTLTTVMVRDLFIDVETFSSVDLKSCGAYKYIESPDFEILLIGYAFDDGPVKTIDFAQGDEYPVEFLKAMRDPECRKHAHNAVFERLSFKRVGIDVPASQWYCTAVKSAYCGLPLSLDEVSKKLDLVNKKLDTGKLLIRYFSCPCKPTRANGMRTRNFPYHNPEKWELYKEYNRYDVLAEREIYRRLEKYSIPEFEREVYVLDQDINDRGILVDLELAESAIAVDNEHSAVLSKRAKRLTGLDNPNSGTQLKSWIDSRTGETVDSISKDTMPDLIEKFRDDLVVAEVLDIRSKLSRTSVKKYYAMVNCAMADSRVRGMFQFYGANRTGRWAGRLLQLQNLSKNHVSHIEIPRELVRDRDVEMVELLYGDVTDILSQLVRTALIAPKGMVFSVADFSAIEARVISWLANEEWRMEVFRGDGKIYEATGSKMFNVPISAITKGSELRAKSKISELALGYEGALGALKRMGGDRMGLTDKAMTDLVSRWRDANPAIVEMWGEIDAAAKEAVRYHRAVTCTPRNIVFDCDGQYMTIQLPSGRKLFYLNPRFKDKLIGRSQNRSRVLCYDGIIQATRQWGEIDTYGGKLTENIVQAIARDLLANSMLNLDKAGFHPICHIHDECIVEVPAENAEARYEEMARIMGIPPDWASDLPLRADGFTTPFYLKD